VREIIAKRILTFNLKNMKKILTIIMLFGVICGYAQNTPRYAASTKTWTFGTQTWSDVIRIPECNKNDFKNSSKEPQCRSYTSGGKTYYYYNWQYVTKNVATLCPSSWRVPTQSDFDVLVHNTTGAALAAAWGFGGLAGGSSMRNESTHAYYWSSTEHLSGYAYDLRYADDGTLEVNYYGEAYGFQIRCVKFPDGKTGKNTEGSKTNGQKQQAKEQKTGGQKQQTEEQKTDGQKQPPKEQETDGQKQQTEEQKPDGQKQQAEGQTTGGQKQPPKGQKTDGQKGKTPPHAASTKIWTFGTQTWSDAIQMPECNKKDFRFSNTKLECRNYDKDGKTWFYYNWLFVEANKTKMCPSPWRVPTKTDMETLKSNSNGGTLADAWGYGGYAAGGDSMRNVNLQASYWSSTEYSSGSPGAIYLIYFGDILRVEYDTSKSCGLQVRCVK
jgi:uncharacterized protein (TIGR02145 family)